MGNIRELKTRILSVKETQKITQAMKMVSAAKFKRASQNLTASRSYLASYKNVFQNLLARIEPDYIPELMKDNGCEKQAIIIITGDRGLCGGFNANIIKASELYLKATKSEVELHTFGNKCYSYYKSRDWNIEQNLAYFMENFEIESVEDALAPIIEKFYKKEIGKVVIFYNNFKSALSSEVVEKQLFPIIPTHREADSADKKEGLESDFYYEPSQATVLTKYLESYITAFVYTALLESSAGEEGARMAAMDSATDNADDMIKQLSLAYNQSRQAAITKEISEIVGGAEAQA
jgi:F-type H+-transporting ATPase subunit gamma